MLGESDARLLVALALGVFALGGCGGRTQDAVAQPGVAGGGCPDEVRALLRNWLAARETSLGTLPHEYWHGEWVLGAGVAVSPDCRHIAWREQRGEKERMVLDGVAGPLYDSIFDWGPEGPFSTDGSHVAYFAERDGSQFAVIDGKEGPGVDCTYASSLLFSRDGQRVAYDARRGNKDFVVVDGVAEKEYDIVGVLCFSSDGKHHAYFAKRGEKWLIVVDGREGEEYSWVSDPWFSPDGKRVAYGYQDEDGKWFSVVGDTVRGPFEAVEGHTFSADGRRVAFVAAREGRKLIVTDDGTPALAEHEVVGGAVVGMQFSPSGKRFGYVAGRRTEKGESHVAVIDGVAGKEYEEICPRQEWSPEYPRFEVGSGHILFERDERLLFSSDDSHVVYVGRREWFFGPVYAVVDGKEFGPFDYLWPLRLSPDGRRLALVGWRGGKTTLVVDGVEVETADPVSKYEFSPDGTRFAYTTWARDRGRCFLDGKEVPGVHSFWFLPDGRVLWGAGTTEGDGRLILDGKQYPVVGSFRWSPDLKRLARAVKHGKGVRVALDGWESRTYEDVGEILFSPDGAHLVWFARRGDTWRVVIDGVEGNAYDAIVTYPARHPPIAPAFDTPSRLGFLARRGYEVFRVEVEFPGEW